MKKYTIGNVGKKNMNDGGIYTKFTRNKVECRRGGLSMSRMSGREM